MDVRQSWRNQPVLLRPAVYRRRERGPPASHWDLLAWPCQVLTYQSYLFALHYVLMTYLLMVAVLGLGLLALGLVPIALLRFALHLVGCPSRRYYPAAILYGGFQLLVRYDVAVHNTMAHAPVPLTFDANANELQDLLEMGRRPRFVLRLRDGWSPPRVAQYVLYVYVVRQLLVALVLQWVASALYSLEAVWELALLLFFPDVTCTFSFFWGLDAPISCAEHPLGLAGCVVVLLVIFVRLRRPVVDGLCATTTYFCCESVLVLRG
ncbi:hypothetical protein SDRG_02196 [Saprolegnia diclina VS20]|uniref:Uncharacterized protein n=1 Tax=Saprolegnia diclina (strain VS20) TaxID=1156394 RepID=T0QQ82_SAPDV|nr:hypothetical protein SDRG_02196 [Saprolegnia diclina VS20]EQC40294.1 hypothetical protein SDRG_02196 [Saprolegnia diclina VS20]|eukprot:XP_008605993.1 hypothetical protein SDRG_02196 [Saprolegnia diclina VS20]